MIITIPVTVSLTAVRYEDELATVTYEPGQLLVLEFDRKDRDEVISLLSCLAAALDSEAFDEKEVRPKLLSQSKPKKG